MSGASRTTPSDPTEQEREEREYDGSYIRPLPARASRAQQIRHVQEPRCVEHEECAQQRKENRRETEDGRAR
jgi:hypothetical protein